MSAPSTPEPSSEFKPEPLTPENVAALESAAASMATPAAVRSPGAGCLPADAEELRRTFEQLTMSHSDAAALWEKFQAKSDPTGLLQLAMKTRENVRLLEERISAFPLGLSRTVGATPASPAAPPARVAAPVPSQAQVVRSAGSSSPTRSSATAQQPTSVAEARQKVAELNAVFDEAITCVGDVLAACSAHIDKIAGQGPEALGSVAEAASTVRLAYSELARARRAAQNAIAGERAVGTLLEEDMQKLAAKAARTEEMEAQAAEAQQAAQQLRGELAKAQAAAEDAARKAEEYRLQLAASALATQRVKEKEASLDQQQVNLTQLVETAAAQMTADSLAAQKAAEAAAEKARADQQYAEQRLKALQTDLDATRIEVQQLKSDIVGLKLTTALKMNI